MNREAVWGEAKKERRQRGGWSVYKRRIDEGSRL
jgi:hypothetical protein